jgi:hypothetical protein
MKFVAARRGRIRRRVLFNETWPGCSLGIARRECRSTYRLGHEADLEYGLFDLVQQIDLPFRVLLQTA